MLTGPQVESKTGLGEILSPREVRCIGEDGVQQFLKTEKILIAWGSAPQILPGLRTSERIRTSDELLHLEQLPPSMIIVGGSFIGVEYATLFAELGVRVTLVELLDRILPREDEEAANLLGQELARLGVVLHTSTRLVRLEESGTASNCRRGKTAKTWRYGLLTLCFARAGCRFCTRISWTCWGWTTRTRESVWTKT